MFAPCTKYPNQPHQLTHALQNNYKHRNTGHVNTQSHFHIMGQECFGFDSAECITSYGGAIHYGLDAMSENPTIWSPVESCNPFSAPPLEAYLFTNSLSGSDIVRPREPTSALMFKRDLAQAYRQFMLDPADISFIWL